MASRQERILSNPLRVRILDTITAGPACPSQLAAAIGVSFGIVTYHTEILYSAGCIHPVEKEERGSIDPHYEASA